jgi:hypothetical protein
MFTPGGACAPFQPGLSAVAASIGDSNLGSLSSPVSHAPLPLLQLQLPSVHEWGGADDDDHDHHVHGTSKDAAGISEDTYVPDHAVSTEWRPFLPSVADAASYTTSAAFEAAATAMEEKTVVVILRRTAVVETRRWYEFFVTLQKTARGDAVFNFPRASAHFVSSVSGCGSGYDQDSNIARVHAAAQHVYAYALRLRDRTQQQLCEALSRACVLVADQREHNVRVALYDVGTVHLAPWHARRQPLTTAPPRHCWAVESELAWHEHVGKPSVYGVRFVGFARACMETMPPSQRFCTAAPPLVLYHGTSVDALPAIQASGVLPSDADAMLGAGVYFARWDKAARFAQRHAHGGVVLRCVVFAGRVAVVDPDFLCTCGCAQRGVDHLATHATRHDAAYVPGTSTSVRDAEWCVYRAHTRVWIDAAIDRITE